MGVLYEFIKFGGNYMGTEKKRVNKKDEIRNCKRCGQVFHYYGYGYGYCERCTKIDDEVFHKVKDYIWTHKNATVIEVSSALGVSERQIYQYLRDSRLEVPEDSPIFLKCEICSTDIRYGRYCPECAVKMNKDLSSNVRADVFEVGEKPKSMKGKMHFLSTKNE